VRRAVAAGALLVAIVLIVIGVHSCQVSQAHSALRDYNDSVASLIRSSNQNGDQFFRVLASGVNSSNAPAVESQVDQARLTAGNQLKRAENLSTPDEVKTAQQNLVLAMQMRRDAIAAVGRNLQPTLQSTTARAAVNAIAAEMARLYASDVLYKDYTLPGVVTALKNAGIAVGGVNGEPITTRQLLPDVQWVLPSFVAQQLHVTVPSSTSNGPVAPGVHGHSLDGCSIGGNALSTTSAVTVPSGTSPTLSCTVTNDGQNTETNVTVKASVSGTSVTGHGVIPQTQPGQQYTVQIPLSSTPPAGTYDLAVGVQHVPGEKTFTHNSKTFPITFG
jgi:hypothetical protein